MDYLQYLGHDFWKEMLLWTYVCVWFFLGGGGAKPVGN